MKDFTHTQRDKTCNGCFLYFPHNVSLEISLILLAVLCKTVCKSTLGPKHFENTEKNKKGNRNCF